MTENCLVLTGGPGTGKTTTVKAILNLLESRAERVALCAPPAGLPNGCPS